MVRSSLAAAVSPFELANVLGAHLVPGDDSKGYFVQPTVILTTNPHSVTMTEEIFGPVLTIYVYDDNDFEKTLDLVDSTSQYALTGSMCVESHLFFSIQLTYFQLRHRPQGSVASHEQAAQRGRQRLLQREVHGRRRWAAAVRWCAC